MPKVCHVERLLPRQFHENGRIGRSIVMHTILSILVMHSITGLIKNLLVVPVLLFEIFVPEGRFV